MFGVYVVLRRVQGVGFYRYACELFAPQPQNVERVRDDECDEEERDFGSAPPGQRKDKGQGECADEVDAGVGDSC